MAKTLEKSVVTCDMEGRIETISKGSERIFGYTEEELIGKKGKNQRSMRSVDLETIKEYAGEDQQLNKAIEVIMKQLKDYKPPMEIPSEFPDKSK